MRTALWMIIAAAVVAQRDPLGTQGDLPVPDSPLHMPEPPPPPTGSRWPSSDTLPPGSFDKTCRDLSIDWRAATIAATCRRRNGSYQRVAGFYFRYCVPGSIGNYDGALACTHDPAAAAADAEWARRRKDAEARENARLQDNQNRWADQQAVRRAMEISSITVFGRALPKIYYDRLYGEYRKLDPATPAENIDRDNMFRFLLGVLTYKTYTALREFATDSAFLSVHGRTALSAEKAAYEPRLASGDLWSQRVATIERNKLAIIRALRIAMLARAFNDALGRAPTDVERAAWLTRKEDYAGTVEAQRAALYAPTGDKELNETVKRALTHLSAPNGFIFVSEAVARCRPGKATYLAMIQADSCAVPKSFYH